MPYKREEPGVKFVSAKLSVREIDLMDRARFRMQEIIQKDVSTTEFVRLAVAYYSEQYLRRIGEWESGRTRCP